MGVASEHPDYTATKAKRRLMRDVIGGEDKIKALDFNRSRASFVQGGMKHEKQKR